MDKEPKVQETHEKEIIESKSSNKNKDLAVKLEQASGEIGGPSGLEPTRYGDWERKGIVSDF